MFLQEFEQQQQQQLRLKKTKIGSKISNPWQDQFFIELGCEKLVLTWHTISSSGPTKSGLVSNLLILGMREVGREKWVDRMPTLILGM